MIQCWVLGSVLGARLLSVEPAASVGAVSGFGEDLWPCVRSPRQSPNSERDAIVVSSERGVAG